MSSDNLQHTVRTGYDAIAERYHKGREAREAVNIEWLDGLRRFLPESGVVVDLGCGAGVPISRYFATRGYRLTGYDLSEEMVKLARLNVPEATFEIASMEDIELPPDSVDLVVSFFAIIHVPRHLHADLLGRIYRWVKPGGAVLLSLGANDNPDQTDENWHGARMKWSHFDDRTNLRLLQEAGFEVIWSEVEGPVGDSHLFVVARKT